MFIICQYYNANDFINSIECFLVSSFSVFVNFCAYMLCIISRISYSIAASIQHMQLAMTLAKGTRTRKLHTACNTSDKRV